MSPVWIGWDFCRTLGVSFSCAAILISAAPRDEPEMN